MVLKDNQVNPDESDQIRWILKDNQVWILIFKKTLFYIIYVIFVDCKHAGFIANQNMYLVFLGLLTSLVYLIWLPFVTGINQHKINLREW